MPMKNRSWFPLLLAAAILAAQLPSSAAQDKNALKFVRTAADVATNVQSESIDGYTAIYVDPQNWTSASTDSDLGPFVAAQEASPSHGMACLFSRTKNDVVCVYFDDERAYGLTTIKSDRNNPITATAVAASYKQTTKEILKKAPGKIAFSQIVIDLDNGQRLDAYLVKLSK